MSVWQTKQHLGSRLEESKHDFWDLTAKVLTCKAPAYSLAKRLQKHEGEEFKELPESLRERHTRFEEADRTEKTGAAASLGSYDHLLQAQAGELAHLRSLIQEGKGICSLFAQHANTAAKPPARLLRTAGSASHHAQTFREQLAQGSQLDDGLASKLGRDSASVSSTTSFCVAASLPAFPGLRTGMSVWQTKQHLGSRLEESKHDFWDLTAKVLTCKAPAYSLAKRLQKHEGEEFKELPESLRERHTRFEEADRTEKTGAAASLGSYDHLLQAQAGELAHLRSLIQEGKGICSLFAQHANTAAKPPARLLRTAGSASHHAQTFREQLAQGSQLDDGLASKLGRECEELEDLPETPRKQPTRFEERDRTEKTGAAASLGSYDHLLQAQAGELAHLRSLIQEGKGICSLFAQHANTAAKPPARLLRTAGSASHHAQTFREQLAQGSQLDDGLASKLGRECEELEDLPETPRKQPTRFEERDRTEKTGAAASLGSYDHLLQAQAGELAHLRSLIQEGKGICSLFAQHANTAAKPPARLLRTAGSASHHAQTFREQLAQGSQLDDGLASTLGRECEELEDLPETPRKQPTRFEERDRTEKTGAAASLGSYDHLLQAQAGELAHLRSLIQEGKGICSLFAQHANTAAKPPARLLRTAGSASHHAQTFREQLAQGSQLDDGLASTLGRECEELEDLPETPRKQPTRFEERDRTEKTGAAASLGSYDHLLQAQAGELAHLRSLIQEGKGICSLFAQHANTAAKPPARLLRTAGSASHHAQTFREQLAQGSQLDDGLASKLGRECEELEDLPETPRKQPTRFEERDRTEKTGAAASLGSYDHLLQAQAGELAHLRSLIQEGKGICSLFAQHANTAAKPPARLLRTAGSASHHAQTFREQLAQGSQLDDGLASTLGRDVHNDKKDEDGQKALGPRRSWALQKEQVNEGLEDSLDERYLTHSGARASHRHPSSKAFLCDIQKASSALAVAKAEIQSLQQHLREILFLNGCLRDKLERLLRTAGEGNGTGVQGCASLRSRELLRSTVQVYNQNRGVKEEIQSLLARPDRVSRGRAASWVLPLQAPRLQAPGRRSSGKWTASAPSEPRYCSRKGEEQPPTEGRLKRMVILTFLKIR